MNTNPLTAFDLVSNTSKSKLKAYKDVIDNLLDARLRHMKGNEENKKETIAYIDSDLIDVCDKIKAVKRALAIEGRQG